VTLAVFVRRLSSHFAIDPGDRSSLTSFPMKVLLATLLCSVLHTTQLFAISGGPFGGGDTQVAVTGTYAGVMVPVPVDDPTTPGITLTDNSLALFTFSVPKTGLAIGVSAVFRNGYFYPGGIVGTADPDSGKVTGILTADLAEDVVVDLQTVPAHLEATGQFVNAQIRSVIGNVSPARLRGRAVLTYVLGAQGDLIPGAIDLAQSGGPIEYRIHGFKQAEVSS
jgi:hypothetical protein